MGNELVINTTSHETRIALIENGTIAELYIERSKVKGIVGNIYKGRVIRVLPGMQAAFVDIGLEKAAFLYVADVFDAIEEYESFMDGNGKKEEQQEGEEPMLHPLHPDRRAAAGGAGTPGAGLQGADRHQGGADHRPHLAPRPAPGLYADRRPCRHLPADRGRGGDGSG